MSQLEVAMNEVERVEAQLNSYEDVLCHVRNTMEKMEEKNMLIEVANRNNQKLLVELEKVVVSILEIITSSVSLYLFLFYQTFFSQFCYVLLILYHWIIYNFVIDWIKNIINF